MATFLDNVVTVLDYHWKDEKKHTEETYGIELDGITVDEAIEYMDNHPGSGITNCIFYKMLCIRKDLGYANMDI
jgi:hypothetical protein